MDCTSNMTTHLIFCEHSMLGQMVVEIATCGMGKVTIIIRIHVYYSSYFMYELYTRWMQIVVGQVWATPRLLQRDWCLQDWQANMAVSSPSSSPPLVKLISELHSQHHWSLIFPSRCSLGIVSLSCCSRAWGLQVGTKTLHVHVKTVMNVELDHEYVVCELKNFWRLYWVTDTNDMRYVDCTHVCMYVCINWTR